MKKQPITIFHIRRFIDEHMPDRLPTTTHFGEASGQSLGISKSKLRAPGVTAPRYVLKLIDKSMRDAVARVYFCKNTLIADLTENWGRCDLLVQEFVIQKTMQACVYRFYRNERNVYRAECIINKKSIAKDQATA